MARETILNVALALLLLAMPFAASALGEPFYVTLATRMAILALAAVGLNLALGFGGLVSFGHAAFFGIGGYAAGILASHAYSGEPLMTWPVAISGSDQMLVVWLVAALAAGLAALADRRHQPAHQRRLFHHDHAGLRADDLLFRHLLAVLWRRGRAVDHAAQRLSGPEHGGADELLPDLLRAADGGAVAGVAAARFTLRRGPAGGAPERGTRRIGRHRRLARSGWSPSWSRR